MPTKSGLSAVDDLWRGLHDAALANWPARWPLWRCAVAILALLCLPGARTYLVSADKHGLDRWRPRRTGRSTRPDCRASVELWRFIRSSVFRSDAMDYSPTTRRPSIPSLRFVQGEDDLGKSVQSVCDQIAATLRAESAMAGRNIPLSQHRHWKFSPRRTIHGDGWTILALTCGVRRSVISSRCTPRAAKSFRSLLRIPSTRSKTCRWCRLSAGRNLPQHHALILGQPFRQRVDSWRFQLNSTLVSPPAYRARISFYRGLLLGSGLANTK